MRVFFSTGEASGELLAAELLGAMRARTAIDAEAIGDARLERAGVRIGTHAFLGGYSKLGRDLPPYLLADGNPPQVYGLNLVGLRRAGFSRDTLRELKEAYKTIYQSDKNVSQAITALRETVSTDEGRTLLAFLEAGSERGILK